MTREEFIQRFQLQALPASAHKFRYQHKLKSAAVLIPIASHQGQLEVVLTKRASHLTHHPGQISFPGGKVERYDDDMIATALRETQEEIGLHASCIDVLGQLKPYQTISGYEVTPIVAIISNNSSYQIDLNEVSEVFHVPLSHFLQRQHHIQVPVYHAGKQHNVHYMPYQDYNIWGATAAMLHDLSILLNQRN
ncbi:CoA pyrophosphatase [Colwellia sp. MB3u-70]|uniref:CoA pyrophosphatase n=1 Tax=unclassified Colwellia TaxID=196834 RepID=UPI0015F6AAF0|nr:MULTISPECIES: CoA pyrophosphatase [unclassified Colwellia]MBA6292543.1 CoA pyrophosphatase [Colwellia sp. MB3u-8]MBA6308754.1 CoA pyrophosphatase [Colwellia sp. MB3u-70]